MTRPLAACLVLLVRLYQWTVRPFLGAHCRFEPSCSEYAIEALRLHGPLRGAGLAAWRIVRCNPWHPGGPDPVLSHPVVSHPVVSHPLPCCAAHTNQARAFR